MNKKIMMLLFGLMTAVSMNAQFEKDKFYVGASASGLDLSFNDMQKLSLDLQLSGGYMFERDWMVVGKLGLATRKYEPDQFGVGLGLRYYLERNGLFFTLGAKYVRQSEEYNDFMPSIDVGYAFFLNRTVTVEPQVYYDISTKNLGDYSRFGVRIGLSIYFE